MKIREKEKRDKFLDLARKLNGKIGWNMKVTVIPVISGALGNVPKVLVSGREEFETGGRSETIQTTVLLRSARILRRVLGDLRIFAVSHTLAKDHQLRLA